jgi:hypothetical protein
MTLLTHLLSSLRAERGNPVSLFALDCFVAFGSSQ